MYIVYYVDRKTQIVAETIQAGSITSAWQYAHTGESAGHIVYIRNMDSQIVYSTGRKDPTVFFLVVQIIGTNDDMPWLKLTRGAENDLTAEQFPTKELADLRRKELQAEWYTKFVVIKVEVMLP